MAKDGSGTHTTINDAVAALSRIGHDGSQRIIIYVKSGVYNENVEIERNLKNVMFVGDGMDKTIVTGNRNVPDGSTTFNLASFGKNKKTETIRYQLIAYHLKYDFLLMMAYARTNFALNSTKKISLRLNMEVMLK